MRSTSLPFNLARLPRAPGAYMDAVAWLAVVLLGLLVWTELPSIIATGAVIAGVALAVYAPTGATAAILTAVPFVFQEVPIGSQNINLLELAVLVAVAGFGIRIGFALLRLRQLSIVSDLLAPWPLTLSAVALAIVATVSLAYVADRDHLSESVAELRKTILEPITVLFLVRWSVRRNGLRLLLTGLAVGGVVASLLGVGQFLTRSGGVVGDETYRARGPYQHPNNLALYLERVVMLAGGLVLMLPAWRRVTMPILAVTTVGLAVTFSRGALLGVAAGVAALLFVRRPTRGWVYYGVGFGGALIVFAAVAGGRLVATGTGGESSSRELLWRSSLKMIADHPIKGVGLDQFLYQYGRRYVDPAGWPERYTSHPHNLLLDVWLRLGVAGLVLFVVLALIAIQIVRSARLGGDLSGAAAAGGVAALIAGVSHGLVDNGFFLPDLAILTWYFLAIVEHNSVIPTAFPALRLRRAQRPVAT